MTLNQGAILLLQWREGQGLSRNKAAKVFRTDRGTYEGWELGVVPSTRFAVAMEDELGIPVRSWMVPAAEQPRDPST